MCRTTSGGCRLHRYWQCLRRREGCFHFRGSWLHHKFVIVVQQPRIFSRTRITRAHESCTTWNGCGVIANLWFQTRCHVVGSWVTAEHIFRLHLRQRLGIFQPFYPLWVSSFKSFSIWLVSQYLPCSLEQCKRNRGCPNDRGIVRILREWLGFQGGTSTCVDWCWKVLWSCWTVWNWTWNSRRPL